ncbi:MAG: PfkB family carbohydrate kinase [Elusimicrobiota bacterium]
MSIVVVGSVALDTVKTPKGVKRGVLGGSAVYASLALSAFIKPKLVGVVGKDFPAAYLKLLRQQGIDVEGLEHLEGKTFAWEGEYDENLSKASTRSTCLNVFGDFAPKIPASYVREKNLFLGNIDPDLQKKVLEQMKAPQLVATDTIDLWITHKAKSLKELLSQIDIFFINNEEAYKLADEKKVIAACRRIAAWGPRLVVVKSGEHGAVAYDGEAKKYYMAPAYPDCEVVDPTGAGDSFAGGFLGSITQEDDPYDPDAIKKALFMGNVLASYTISRFSVEALVGLKQEDLEHRWRILIGMTQLARVAKASAPTKSAVLV